MSWRGNNISLVWRNFLERGDETTFSAIYNEYVDRMFSYGIHLGFTEESCRDAVQDVFCKLYISRHKLMDVQNPASYLFKSLKFRLIDLVRRNSKIESLEHVNDSFAINVTILDKIIDEEKSHLLKTKIENLLNNLTAQQREAIYLRYMLEMDYNEISKMLGINNDSARKLVYRAMEKLREQIGDELTGGSLLFISLIFVVK